MKPLIDVVIAAYNAARTIESAIASIQAQTERNIRIIIVNDGSVDATKQIAERLAESDGRILVLNEEKSGIVDAVNAGLKHAKAEFIARHDADDLSLPDRFATQLAYFAEHSDCVAVSGGFQHIDEAGSPIGEPFFLPPPANADAECIPQREPYLSQPFLMLRRKAADAIGFYRHVIYAEDTDLYWRLMDIGRLHNLPNVLGQYRMHPHSVTASSVINGRISAVNSQRAGLSQLRRRAGKPDLDFPKSAYAEYELAASLDGIIEHGSLDLDCDEAERLRISACAKLVELAGHRAYELERDDCASIRRFLLPALKNMRQPSRSYCSQMLSGTSARLASKGKITEAFLLTPVPLYPAAAAKLAVRTLMPPLLRRRLRQVIRGYGFMR